ncbi:hypothetical protein LVD15_03695 [Fulvivirga maritima]|uniref:hypothetical protein n=1 Tax=Fulvivirga maritima TaxID=2904247 RepID=UPI001F349B8E|nr:hypothetical protein [Fulvivirga maritima]UII27547.1 hypothetical protein LVD15_03695 [Fulvivirga maritima]
MTTDSLVQVKDMIIRLIYTLPFYVSGLLGWPQQDVQMYTFGSCHLAWPDDEPRNSAHKIEGFRATFIGLEQTSFYYLFSGSITYNNTLLKVST